MSKFPRRALFRITQNLNKNKRQIGIERTRSVLEKKYINPLEPKLMGFVSETKSLEVIYQCFICHNPYLKYGFLDYLYKKPEKSWIDIECPECKEFFVEIKSTKKKNPEQLYGGSWKGYKRMNIKPYLLVFSNFNIDKHGKYIHDRPCLYQPDFYKVIPRPKSSKSLIILSDVDKNKKQD